LSYLRLRGRCAGCQRPIGIRYPAYELLTALASALVGLHFGFGPACIAALLLTWCLVALTGIDLDGLMCIAPDVAEVGGVEGTRPAFKQVSSRWRELAGFARDHGHSWHHLSMGMTGDFEVAIEEGATLVRVGRAIFGDRST